MSWSHGGYHKCHVDHACYRFKVIGKVEVCRWTDLNDYSMSEHEKMDMPKMAKWSFYNIVT